MSSLVTFGCRLPCARCLCSNQWRQRLEPTSKIDSLSRWPREPRVVANRGSSSLASRGSAGSAFVKKKKSDGNQGPTLLRCNEPRACCCSTVIIFTCSHSACSRFFCLNLDVCIVCSLMSFCHIYICFSLILQHFHVQAFTLRCCVFFVCFCK